MPTCILTTLFADVDLKNALNVMEKELEDTNALLSEKDEELEQKNTLILEVGQQLQTTADEVDT